MWATIALPVQSCAVAWEWRWKGLGHVPDFPEWTGAAGGVFLDHAGELDAGHVYVAHFLNTQQLRIEHDHLGLVGCAARMGFAVCQLRLDLLQHVVGHHGPQVLDV